jgi:hypothetical protein
MYMEGFGQAISFWVGTIGVLSGGLIAYHIWQEEIYLTSPHPFLLCTFIGFYFALSLYQVVSALIFRFSIGKSRKPPP